MTPREVLKKYWGYDSFRPLQADIVRSVLSGRDTLGLMPTGGGKSITFQVPGLIFDGLTVVVTPLISLMKDQVDNLRRHHIRAVYFHAGMSLRERNVAMEHLTNGKAKFLYIAPERLKAEQFMNRLRMLDVSFIVVDEAHCISQWGYDFRPSYLNISSLRAIAPQAPVLALTATATPEVAQDICHNLAMKDPALLRMSFTRSNLSYIVRPAATKISEVLHILSRTSRLPPSCRPPAYRPRHTMPVWISRSRSSARMTGGRTRCASWWLPTPSAWVSTNRTCES